MTTSSPTSSGSTIFVSTQTILPGSSAPEPATIIVDDSTGRITEVIQKLLSDEEILEYGREVNEVIRVPSDKVLLPGLVE
jgi:hypothetical protein